MVELEVLGLSVVSTGGEDASPEPVRLQPKRFALFTYLAVARPRGFHRRDALLALFWPESTEKRARNALNQSLHSLRSALGDGVLLSKGYSEVGVASDRLRCDVLAFEEAFDADRFSEALGHYRGDLLDGFHVSGVPGFERWLDTERSRLRRQARAAASELADRRERDGNPIGAARWLERALEISPSDESLLRRLMTLLDHAGDRAGALRVYERFASDLRSRLGTEPSPETREVVAEIRERTEPAPAAGPATGRSEQSTPSSVRSLAVLPLTDLRDEPEQAYFVEGMAEALIGELARIESLRVISRQSVLRFRDSDRPLSEIGDVLGVDAVIEGSVLRVGDRVRLSLQLLTVEPEEHLWADAFERDLSDVLSLQRDVARAVAERVEGALDEGVDGGSGQLRKIEPAAFDALLLGVAPVMNGRVDEYPEALDHLRRAVELDPGFGEPLAWIAQTYGNMAGTGILPPEEARGPMRDAARRALELDEEPGPANVARALWLQMFERDWKGAEEAYRRSLVEGAATVFEPWTGWFVMLLACQGDFEEALARAREEYRKDPLGPASWLLGYALHKARRFDESVERLELTLRSWPDAPFTHPFLAGSYLFAGRREEAIRTARRALDVAPDNQLMLGYGAATLARAGQTDDARDAAARLRDMRRDAYADPFNLAVAWAGLEERDRALDELERLVEEGSPQSFAIPAEPFFDPLRAEARFNAVLERLNLPRLEF